jgi:hypothetical protein
MRYADPELQLSPNVSFHQPTTFAIWPKHNHMQELF